MPPLNPPCVAVPDSLETSNDNAHSRGTAPTTHKDGESSRAE
jgi:hypothetical protein